MNIRPLPPIPDQTIAERGYRDSVSHAALIVAVPALRAMPTRSVFSSSTDPHEFWTRLASKLGLKP